MEQQDASTTGIYGHAAEDWERILDQALDQHDHEGLLSALFELNAELHHENAVISGFQRGPRIDRLVEQARRILASEPTVSEVFEEQAFRERELWSRYRERYRQAFIPAPLHGFLSTSAVFIEPTGEGTRFPGFDKFGGVDLRGNHREAVTLFYADEGDNTQIPANFFGCFDVHRGRFTVERAYRTDLPCGAGRAIIAEQIRALVPDLGQLREFEWDNVQNLATYQVFVDDEGDSPRLRPTVDVAQAPLVRVGRRILESVGLNSTGVTPTLDQFGFMDLCQLVD